MYLTERIYKYEQEYHRIVDHCVDYRLWLCVKCVWSCAAKHFCQCKLRKLWKKHTAGYSHNEWRNIYYKSFPQKYPWDVPLIHSENVVKSELGFSSADNEWIRVKEKNCGKNDHYAAAHIKEHMNCCSTLHFLYKTADGKKRCDVVHHYHSCAGEDIRKIYAAVLFYAVDRKLRVQKHSVHQTAPPEAIKVRVSEIFL